MIVVIADDLTGAGEIGGIGLAYGLTAEIQREFYLKSDVRLLIIDTDTRSCSPEEAGQKIREITYHLKTSGLPVEWVYKKTDSVLRGPVAGELEALQDVMCAARVLLVPANPTKGRIICNGNYLIKGIPLSETDFANDPEYPATTSNILKLPALSGARQIHLLKSGQVCSCAGIVIGQAETTYDLLEWSQYMDEQTILAGAGEFFEAILRSKGFSKGKVTEDKEYPLGSKALFVCGSSSDSSRKALRQADSLGRKICRMPEALFNSDCPEDIFIQQWSDDIIRSFEKQEDIVIAVDREAVGNAEFAGKLRSCMAAAVWCVLQKIPLKELFVEGGATASQIVGCFGWSRFEPSDQLGPGVVRMKVWESNNLYLTIKPGSYPWPKSLWEKEEF